MVSCRLSSDVSSYLSFFCLFVLLKFDILLSESITLLLAFCDEDAKVEEISEILKLFAVFFLLHIVFLGFLSRFQPFFHVLWLA